jgi:hypothetical protein
MEKGSRTDTYSLSTLVGSISKITLIFSLLIKIKRNYIILENYNIFYYITDYHLVVIDNRDYLNTSLIYLMYRKYNIRFKQKKDAKADPEVSET